MTDLVSERLILRPWDTSDVNAVVEGVRQPSWAADFPAEGDTVIAGVIASNPEWLSPFGHRLIIERATSEVVGSLGLFWPPSDGRVEIGYGVVPSRQGLGYASEATAALTSFALSLEEVHTVHASVEPTNPASARVLEKAGFTRYADTAELISYRRTVS
ncbi:RimJ/RimL family protein N-acetyltransferase [Lentzea atacamensis]|uniref:RimJ/RimL family protein N-acetyltransferase n=1 Tax=Lentzea atacamensis TaxID=531938 RepID=A0ABX9E6C7_9PSEU|nr:GNAT family N-acetyltransferase [Lentzea atacamensis]RAS63736.1 RimJ/RimL family protein N-acetyltransferase [Lentzea atacamensis]